VIGAVALAASISRLSEIGMETIAAHEAALTRYALWQLATVPGIKIYGSTDLEAVEKRVGVIPFSLDGITHGKLAAILGYEGGIGVRNGCFCAHPYILHLLGVTDSEYRHYHDQVLDHDRSDMPGLVRMSFGCYNNTADVDHLVGMLQRIASGDYQGDYIVDRRSGSYYPRGFQPQAVRDQYFQFSSGAVHPA
jgi:selenocysteine lyase/cysteine desulfurase